MLQVKIVRACDCFSAELLDSYRISDQVKAVAFIDAGGEPEKLQAEVEALGLTVKALWLSSWPFRSCRSQLVLSKKHGDVPVDWSA